MNLIIDALPDWRMFVPTLGACVLIVFFLYKVLKKPLGKYFSDKSNKIANDINKAKKAVEEAKEKVEKTTIDLLEVKNESMQILQSANVEASLVAQEIAEVSKREAETLIVTAQKSFENELKLFEAQQKEHLLDTAIKVAIALTEKNLDSNISKKLINEILEAK